MHIHNLKLPVNSRLSAEWDGTGTVDSHYADGQGLLHKYTQTSLLTLKKYVRPTSYNLSYNSK